MTNYVNIKSFPHGLKVFLDEKATFDELLNEIVIKFKDSEKFFKNTKIAITFEGRTLTDSEERQIIGAIVSACDIQITCIVGKDQETEHTFLKAVTQMAYEEAQNTGQFYKGTLKDGQLLETEKSIVILGDVYPNASIISKKNIVILGGLYGEAYAGADGANHFIIALDMAPQKLRIGDFRGQLTEKQNRWLIKPKHVPKIAYVKDNRIVFEDIKFTEELLNALVF
ncbi:MAG: septum site-determining protein MinC [Lachnospiraceae bacterium]|nr:septum site-determining protein MinC [Lachnospiraceae bacterium]